MKINFIQRHFGTKALADKALSALKVKPPATGGVGSRHRILLRYSYRELKSLI